MVRRQSEEDIAQLLSFTYYHKLNCYDKRCICQFFTQYCQDPIKFKQKKKRSYQGFVDDGLKFIEEKEFIAQNVQDADLSLSAQGMKSSAPSQSITRNNQVLIAPMTLKDSTKIDVSLKETNGVQNQIQQKGAGDQSVFNFKAQDMPTQSLNREGNAQEIENQTIGGQSNNQTLFDSAGDLSQNDLAKAFDADNQNEERGDQFMSSIYDYREQGIMLQMTKGLILSGASYSGFDTNLDFKIKNEFKSPSQFKTLQEARTYFFTRLLEMMFRQLESRTSKNISFNLIYIFFHFQYQQNIYLSINTLVKLSKNLKQSVLQKMTFAVSEYYMLELILQEFKKNTKEQVDYSLFIKSNQMTQKLDWLFEDAATDIIQFWSIFRDENANVRKAYELGMKISVNIKQIREYTQTLEEKDLIKDYNKYYYYAMFYQNLLSDKQQYNQMVTNLKNLIMIRNMKKKNSRFGVSNLDINDLAFAILSYEDDKIVGRFTYCNKIASKIFGASEERIIGESVINIMPEMVRLNHEMFIKRFLQDGLPRLFGRVRNLFVKDFKDYIIPVQFFINFHYSSQFSYSLVLHLDPITSVNYYGSSVQIPIKYCVFFVCNSDHLIINFSQNATNIFGLTHKVKKEQEEIIGRGLKMEDMVHQFGKMENQIETNGLRYLPNQLLKVRNFSQFSYDYQYTFCSITFNQVEYLHNHQGNFVENIYMVIPCTNVPDLDIDQSGAQSTINPDSRNSHPNHKVNSRNNSDNHTNSKNLISQSDVTKSLNEGDDGVQIQISQSVSSMSSNTSRNSSSSVLNNTKNLLFSQRSPRVLNLYLYIVFGVFLSFMLITSINFIIYIQKKNSVDLKIQFNKVVNKRNTYLASTLLTIKQLHIISFASKINSTQSLMQNKSNIFNQSRFELYSQELNLNRDALQDYHNQYKQLEQLHSADLGTKNAQFNVFDQLNLSMVSENGKLYIQNNSLDFGFSILVSNLGMINSQEMLKENIPLDLRKHLLNRNGTGQVTPLLRSLYYVYENGLTSLNSLASFQESLIQANTIKTSDESKLFVNLISFISIGLITLIGVFTFPLLGKIEDRKISVLKFFNLLSVDQIQEMLQKGKEFQQEFDQMTRGNKSQKRRDYIEEEWKDDGESGQNMTADIVGIRDSSTKNQLKSKLDGKTEKAENGSGSANEISNIIKKIKDNDYMRDKRDYMKKKKKEYQKTMISAGSKLNLNGAFKSQGQDEEVKAVKLVKKSKKNLRDQALAMEVQKIKKGKSKTKGLKMQKQKDDVNGKEENKNTDEEETDSDGEKERNSKKQKQKNLKDLQQQDMTSSLHMNNNANSSSSRSEQIAVQVEKIALGEKLKLAFYVLMVLAFLNSCLFICFYLGQKTFKDDAKTLDDLSTFYQRENCLDNLMLYTLEQYVQNKTVSLNAGGRTSLSFNVDMNDSADYYMKRCQSVEQEYNSLRRDLPQFLIDSQSSIENLESSNLCSETYKTNLEKKRSCETIYDQIMKRGLTSTMYMIFNFAQQLTVRFQMDTGILRTQKFLQDKLLENKVKDIVDLITFYVHDSLYSMDNIINTNALSYFEQLANYYKIIYVSYMVISVLMSFVFGLVIFKKLKEQIMTSANILVIMPLEELEHKDRLKIDAFLNS